MSDDATGKPRPPVSMATIDRLADRYEREEMERLLAATDEELDEELKEDGFAADEAAGVLQAALAKAPAPAPASAPASAPAPAPASAPAPAKLVNLADARAKRGRSTGWLALVAAAAAVAVVGGGGAAYVALRTPEPAPSATPGPSIETAPPRPPPEELAKQDADARRRRAVAECGTKDWGDCAEDLGKAAQLDPAGDVGATRRLYGRAVREVGAADREAKLGALGPRSLIAEERPRLAAKLAAHAGQAARVVCARGAEPESYCRELAAAMTKGGWVVTREVAARDAGVVHGVAVTVATGADEATEDAGEALADALAHAGVRAGGPDDVPGAAPGVTLTVGER